MRRVLLCLISIGLCNCLPGAQPGPEAPGAGVTCAANLNDLARQFTQNEMLRGAELLLIKAVELDPRGLYYYNLCLIRSRLGHAESALEACHAVKSDNADGDIWRRARGLEQKLQGQLPQSGLPPRGRDGGHGTQSGANAALDSQRAHEVPTSLTGGCA